MPQRTKQDWLTVLQFILKAGVPKRPLGGMLDHLPLILAPDDTELSRELLRGGTIFLIPKSFVDGRLFLPTPACRNPMSDRGHRSFPFITKRSERHNPHQPRQYHAGLGTERPFEEIVLDEHHSASADRNVTIIQSVKAQPAGGSTALQVKAGDPSDTNRVVVACTDNQGSWKSIDLPRDGASGAWQGTVPMGGDLPSSCRFVDGAPTWPWLTGMDNTTGRAPCAPR